MSLTIRKKGNKNFFHYYSTFEPYSASDMTLIFDGDFMKLRGDNGRIVFLREGFRYTDVIVYDDSSGGGAETFSSIQALEQRLINLGHPAYTSDGDAEWGGINGNIENQTDLIDYINENAGGTPSEINPVENEYADIASMLADQVNQTTNFFEYVVDASADPTVGGGDAYYEKLNTNTSSLGDYRKLSDEETVIVNNNGAYNRFRVRSRQDDSTPITSVQNGGVGLEYNTLSELVTGFFLNRAYSDIIENIVSGDATYDYVLRVYNQTKRKEYLTKVTGFSVVNTNFRLVSVTPIIDILEIDLDDRLVIQFDVDVEGSGGGATLEQEVTQVAHGLVVGDWVRMDGANFVKALADTATNAQAIGYVKAVADVDTFTYQYGGIVAIAGLTDGDNYFLQDDGSIANTVGTVNLFVGTQTPQGFLIEIGQGFEEGAGGGGLPDGGTTGQVLKKLSNTDGDAGWGDITSVIAFVFTRIPDDIINGDSDYNFYAPFDFVITNYWIGLNTVSSSGNVEVDLKVNGISIASSNAIVDANEETSLTGTSPTISSGNVLQGQKVTPSVISSGTGAKGASIYIEITQI